MKALLRVWPLVVILLAGCAGRQEFTPPEPDEEKYAPPKLDYSLPAAQNGSLYRHQYSMTLFQDRRAYRVGDMLTVVLSEETESSKKADTKYGKNSSVGFATPSLGGKTIDELAASVDAQRGFDGSASSSQGNKLEGAITVTVHEVLPNGVLRISGEKWIRLNQGDEFIRLTGIVRVDDVSRNNQVSSARIGDARITYSGRGTLADSNAAGWLSQFFNSPWMPF
ncbi:MULTISPECIES: flagellar basal body L-ring protein FlgH [Vibrio]|uniref:Flagellar L-ring protein n=1 Tax=Vibrio neptunius TaxID=170651 RepID=A0ABS3A9L0_9VIBR|nr:MULTISPECIES: flagellar basal body L-ring protein FlgH [Vibrio]KJY87068.1 flagellar basal body L-ring protein [Vibrio neptunius]MBN3495043.1 flagellar basal body L-ring protein FlgH [Vibrio neptunius]MBN3517430.1 flagellar basal body L-ring protein FlgH [Vibrio neptunius]MBN3551378.1 flagellar basal body L-ring protein FlgH [Vibrio neptunius]MBN3575803.1 flagellar basal body L-ring protein FlgH [Vibrio neptunius]